MFCCRGGTRTRIVALITYIFQKGLLALLPITPHDIRLYVLSEVQAHAGAKPCLRYLVIR